MVLNVIFSFNRAMQLDYLLKSILKNYNIEYKIVVIYHTTGRHKVGYDLLKKKYKQFVNISFEERKPNIKDLTSILKIRNKSDLKFFFQKTWPFFKNGDNFKSLLEQIIERTSSDLVMFNTDDGYYAGKVSISSDILEFIKSNSNTISYRLYVGSNHVGIPAYVKKWGENTLLWNYYADKEIHHWSFPFAVDGTIYSREVLQNILKNIIYHNPVTLEGRASDYVIKNRLLGIGLSPINLQLICTKLNRVSEDSLNPTIHIDTNLLNERFIEGYHLELLLPEICDNANVVPENVFIVKGNERISLYELDDYGRSVQSNLGAEGAKMEMK